MVAANGPTGVVSPYNEERADKLDKSLLKPKPLPARQQSRSSHQQRLDRFKATLQKLVKIPSINQMYKKLAYDRLNGNKANLTMFTILIMFLSETPLFFFTFLDILKLKSLFKYRLHYAQEHVAHLGIRNYPPLSLTLRTLKTAMFHFMYAYTIPATLGIKLGSIFNIYVYDTEEGEDKLTWTRFWKEFWSVAVLADIFFWVCHRTFHLPGLYKSHHKVHHEFKYSIASAHHWNTFFEAFMFIFPQALAPMCLWPVFGKRVHLMSMWAGILFSQTNAIVGHAGYNLPFVPKWFPFLQPEYHDFHHIDFYANFAAMFPMTDMLFGTYVQANLEHSMPKILANAKKVKKFK